MEAFEARLKALEEGAATSAAQNEALAAQVAQLKGENDGLRKDLANAAKSATTSVGPAEKVEKPKTLSVPETPFTVGGQKYKFKFAQFINAKGETVRTAELLGDKKALEAVVKEHPGVVVKIDS